MYVIDREMCADCGLCADICPAEAISIFSVYKIDPTVCTSCGECADACPVNAITSRE